MSTRNERGFTIVELLMAVSILGILIGVLASALFVGLRTTDQTQERLEATHTLSKTAAFFVTDVQSAASITTSGAVVCGSGNLLINLTWSDEGVAKAVSYTWSAADAVYEIGRHYCEASASAASVVVARGLTSQPTATYAPPVATLNGSHSNGFTLQLRGTQRNAP